MRSIAILLLVATTCLVCAPGCTSEAPEGSTSQAANEFEGLVAAGDEALEAGDAKAAFDLYTEALKGPDASDTDGTVAEKQEHAKALYIARNILAQEANPMDPKDSVTILVEYSAAATETAEAKRRVIEFLQAQADSMRHDIPALKATIEAEEEFQVPLSIYMADEMTDTWTKTLSRIPGDFGTKALAGMALLARSADEANMITQHQWVEECVADLETCEATLAELDAMLATMRSEL